MRVEKNKKYGPPNEPAPDWQNHTGDSPNRQPIVTSFLLPLFVFCWPIVYLFRLVVPINGRYTALINDFIILSYRYKVYLLDHFADLSFPLWSPSEAAGFPFYVNPFAQAFYPLNLLLAVWYKISGGYNPIDHQVFTVLGVSIFALGLFMWLRLINTNLRAVVFGALVMSVSFKVTEILRFPNAVHTTAWYPWILYALTRIIFSQTIKKLIISAILLLMFLFCFSTGGYPYYVYYSQFLFVPYILIFLVKPLRVQLFGIRPIRWKPVLATLAVTAIIAALTCGPYLLGIKRLMTETADRGGKDFRYSTSHVFNFEDTVGSLVYPPNSETEGWYFFSITAVLVLFLYFWYTYK